MGLQIKEMLNVAENILMEAGVEDAKIDAETLLMYEIRYDRKKLFMNWTREIEDGYCEGFFDLIQKRAMGTPAQYLTNEQIFMGYSFYVDERVLIPRMETEVLVEQVIRYVQESGKKGLKALDLCTGSGVIAICLAKSDSTLRITASDVDASALDVAAENASRMGVSHQIKFMSSDLFGSFKTGFSRPKFDLIVANPPYIPSSVVGTLQREIVEHEPLKALDGGADGLDFYKRIAADAPIFMQPGGELFLEIGYDQGPSVTQILQDSDMYSNIRAARDLSGDFRVVSATVGAPG